MATTAPHMSGQPRIPQTLATLCDICSTVDFDLLRVPTAGDMRRLATGEDVLDRIQHRYPFKRGLGNEKPWIIGTLDRVKKSATSCDLCRLVCQRVMELDRDQPGRVNPNNIWRIEIFYINAMVKLPPNARPHPNIIKQNVKEKAEDVIYNVHALNLTWDDPKPDITLWQHGSLGGSGCWMQAFDPSALTDETAVFDDNALADNRLLLAARQTTPKIHPNLIQTWLHECLTKHDEKCTAVQSSKSRLINVLRLIDVQTKSVKRFPEADISSFEYVALSYVWGQAQKLSITRANKDDLAKDGALVGRVSKTIEDAIALTESLGIPYIWVDALCILQDNDDDKMVHLDFMSEIYRYAKLTVIAACGQDAAAPLSGVCEPRHNLCQQHVLKVREATDRQPALYLTTTPEIRRIHTQYSHLDDTFWATRGWTLQEKVVSRRTVIITPYQVYWSCRTSEWTEAMFLETRLVQARILSLATRASFLTGAGTMQGGRSQDDADAIWDQFCVATNNFSQRRLTVQGDAYDAVSSITQEFSAMADVHCIWGIPVSRFELGLCWTRTWERTGQAKLHRRTVLTALPMTSLKCNLPFPSWTWLGWVGTTTLRLQDNEYGDGISPDIRCFTLRHNPLRIVEVRKTTGTKTEQSIPAFLRNHKLPKSEWSVTVDDIAASYPDLNTQNLAAIPDEQIIFFWTEVAEFTLVGPIHEANTTYRDSDYYRFEIRDEADERVGSTDYCFPEDPKDMTCSRREGRHEFVLLARNVTKDNPAEKIVLQIMREDDIVKRVGIADILEDAWIKAKPRRELIAMT